MLFLIKSEYIRQRKNGLSWSDSNTAVDVVILITHYAILNTYKMASFEVVGRHRLQGEIVPQGAKNEALQILCAVLLTPEKVTIHNIPDIRDVNNLIELLRDMGVHVERLGADSYTFDAGDVDMAYLESDKLLSQSRSLRGSVMFLGPILARFGRFPMPKPG